MSESLVIAPQWIGDAVMSEPLLADLAARGERVTVAALPWVAPVYRAMDSVSAVELLPFSHGKLHWAKRRAVGRQLWGRFTLAYVLPNSLKAALLPWLAAVPRRVGYLGESRYLLLNRRLPNPPGRPPMVDFYRALATLGVEAKSGRAPVSFHAEAPVLHDPLATQPPTHRSTPPSVSSTDHGAQSSVAPRLRLSEALVKTVLSRHGLTPQCYVAFAPGAEYGPAKCWPPDHYADLARRLHDEHGQRVVLLGSSKESELARNIAAQAGPGCLALAGATTLDEAMALIAGARALVSNDSGLMHVAAAFGLPQVALFGSSSPEHTPPLNPRARVLWLKHEISLECSPCFERVCRFGHTRCLADIEPQRAAAALLSTLAG
jgi:heptosyltransferase-2